MTVEYGAGQNPERGVLSSPLLLSAVWAPREAGQRQEDGDPIITSAAALLRSLIKNHPFVDGNKRTAVMVTQLFLSENGWTPIPGSGWVELALRVAAYAGEDTPNRAGNFPLSRVRKTIRRLVTRTAKPEGHDFFRAIHRAYRRFAEETQRTALWADDRYDIHGRLIAHDGRPLAPQG